MSENSVTFPVSKCLLAQGKLTPTETLVAPKSCDAAFAFVIHAMNIEA
jgi:hypothetical protein